MGLVSLFTVLRDNFQYIIFKMHIYVLCMILAVASAMDNNATTQIGEPGPNCLCEADVGDSCDPTQGKICCQGLSCERRRCQVTGCKKAGQTCRDVLSTECCSRPNRPGDLSPTSGCVIVGQVPENFLTICGPCKPLFAPCDNPADPFANWFYGGCCWGSVCQAIPNTQNFACLPT